MAGWGRFSRTSCLLLLCTGAAWAQRGGTQGEPTGPTPSPGVNDQDLQTTMSSPSSKTDEAPMTPLSGVEQFLPGSTRTGPSYVLPAAGCTAFADTNPTFAPGPASVQSLSICLGDLTLQRVGRRSKFNLSYAGGGFFFTRRVNTGFNPRPLRFGTFQSLSVAESVTWRRLRLVLMDDLVYLPESAFGFGGFAGLGSFGFGVGGASLASPPTLNPTLGPSQTILTGRARSLSNVVATQLEYRVRKRSMLTASGVYGKIHFLDAGFSDYDYWDLLAGYNVPIGRRDEVGVSYLQEVFRLGGFGNRQILNRGGQLSYGHRLTGRLSVALSVGPLISRVQLPLGGSVTRTLWNTSQSLQYGRNNIGMSFARYTTAGSGVLQGAETELASLSFSKQLSRRVRAGLGAAYAHNQALTQGTQIGPKPVYQTWEGSASLSREFGPTTSVYLSYQLQRQTANTLFCFGSNCGRSLLRHMAGLGINWHSRPIALH